MKYIRAVLVALVFPALLMAQEEVTYSVIMHPALDSLRALPPGGNETGWCVDFYTKYAVSNQDRTRADTVIRVFFIHRSPYQDANAGGVNFVCPPGTPELHTHTADLDGRVACDASRIDHRSLTALSRPFGIVWCTAPGTVTYKAWHDDTLPSIRCDSVVVQGSSCRLPRPPDGLSVPRP